MFPVEPAYRLLVCLTALCAVSAVSLETEAAPSGSRERPLVVMLGSEPATLDPLLATDANGVRISHQLIFETLVRLDDNLEIVPGLARWQRLTPTHYRFRVTGGVRFHNGAALTAEDAVYTLRRFMAPEVASPYGGALREKIAAVQVLDDATFEVRLNAPYAAFLSDLILPVVSSQQGAIPTPWGDLNGSGPFRFESREVGKIVLVRNPDYRVPAGVARVVLKVVKDESTRLLKFRKGDVHLGINVLPLDKLVRFQRPPLKRKYRILEAPGLSYQYLGFNLADPVLSKHAVRKALAHAINVEALIEHRQKGHSTRATGLLAPGSPYADPALQPIPYDPQRARRLLDEAGFPQRDGPRFSLTYKTSTDRSAVIQARIIQSDLRSVGIELEVRSYEWATFYHDIRKGNFQLYSLRWIGVSDPAFLYELLHSRRTPPLGRNRGGYASPVVDALLERARLEPDFAKRRDLYRQVHRRVYADLPYLSLWHNNNVAIVSRALEGMRLHPSGGFEHLAAVRWSRP